MKKINKLIVNLLIVVSLGLFFSCEQEENDLTGDFETSLEAELEFQEKKGSETNCTKGKSNSSTRDVDLDNPVNTGKMDDRTCHQDYYELTKFNKEYGNYRIAENSNHWDTSTLQPRMERSYPRANDKIGSNFNFKGTFIIERVGTNSNANRAGTYIAQTKGKFKNQDKPANDPAICLYLAKKNKDGDFDIYAERIKGVRSTSGGREVVYLTTVKKGIENTLEVRMGFKTVNGKTQHYCNTFINGMAFYWNVPQASRGLQSGFRYGAYRCTGGSAHIRWANTVYNRVNK